MRVSLNIHVHENKTYATLTFMNDTSEYRFLAKDRVGVSPLTGNFFLFRGADVPFLGSVLKRTLPYENEEIIPVEPGGTFQHQVCLDDYYDLSNVKHVEIRYSASHPAPKDSIFLNSMWVNRAV